ncbi:hypothetical protein LCGC14_1374320 [marine sediment metagenome]|uniref:Uncharacterized protein n=1 Tax=marine sediment metagenome TaxID=412755 RepID=A0A0F9K4H4_9ZZZZ
MSYDPTQASDPIPRKFKNVMRCTSNEVITMTEAVSRGRYFKGLPEGVSENEPYWDFFFEALDAKWLRDGTPLSWKAAGRLYTKEGKRQDNTAKPALVSTAFAGLPERISVFPADPEGKFNAFCASVNDEPLGANPNYDASKVLGRVFLCEIEVVAFGTDMPLPITAYPEDYLFTGKVRELGSSTGGDEQDGIAPASNNLVDITKPGGEEALKQILGILDGQAADADLFDLLRTGGLDNRTLIDGESVLGVAVNDGALTTKLTEAGHITINDGKIAVSTS